jgi:tRNA threonylcarbamoyl adenosine modification protein YeaZ
LPNWILAIDTSAGTSVALLQGDEVRAEVNIPDAMKHAELIGSAIAQVLSDAGVAASEVSSVVVGRGPAPFTGLRVGIAAAVMFSAGVEAPIFGVVSHDAIALAQLRDKPELAAAISATSPLLVTTDARRREVYWATYSGVSPQGLPLLAQGPGVLTPAALEDYLVDRNLTPIKVEGIISAAAIGQLFSRQLLAGLGSDDISALYLREPDAVPSPGKKVSG